MSCESKEGSCCGRTRRAAWVLGTLGTLLIMVVLVGVLVRSTRPADIAAARALERVAFLKEVRAAEAVATTTYGWQDRAKGVVRVPVTRGMELVLQEWQDPAAAKSNLVARVEKATAVAPPPPNVYE